MDVTTTSPAMQHFFYEIMDFQNKHSAISQSHPMTDTPNSQDAEPDQKSKLLARLSSWWSTPPPSDETLTSSNLCLLPTELRLQIYTHLAALSESRAQHCLGVFVTHTPASELQRAFLYTPLDYRIRGCWTRGGITSIWSTFSRTWSFEPRGKDCYVSDAVFADYARDWPDDIERVRETMQRRILEFPNAIQRWMDLAKEYGVGDAIAPVEIRLFIPIPKFALPGDSLAPTSNHTPSTGSHVFASTIHASLAGPVTSAAPTKKAPAPTISVASSSEVASTYTAALPSVNDIILGRITRTNPRQATLDILALGPTGTLVLREPFSAIIRQQDIRATEIDKVKVNESFRVGDIVRGVVISLGDERSYFASTAKNEFGVVLAVSEGGEQMVPVSWREMREVGGGKTELRKVAKPV
ncbi:hypothetical protein E4T39_03137 [Aureobasidium subglaciale]|nr:hypothetical protein E4T39_03137 [Aureobasidium subglaciale]